MFAGQSFTGAVTLVDQNCVIREFQTDENCVGHNTSFSYCVSPFVEMMSMPLTTKCLESFIVLRLRGGVGSDDDDDDQKSVSR